MKTYYEKPEAEVIDFRAEQIMEDPGLTPPPGVSPGTEEM